MHETCPTRPKRNPLLIEARVALLQPSPAGFLKNESSAVGCRDRPLCLSTFPGLGVIQQFRQSFQNCSYSRKCVSVFRSGNRSKKTRPYK